MSTLLESEIHQLFGEVTRSQNSSDLWRTFTSFLIKWGFIYARLSVFGLHAKVEPDNIVFIQVMDHTDHGWADHYIEKQMYEYDQSFHLVRTLGVEYLKWSSMRKLTTPGTRAYNVFVEADQHGLEEGALIGHSSIISKNTAFLGVSGPKDVLDPFKKTNMELFAWVCHIVIARTISLAKREKLLSIATGKLLFKPTRKQKELLYALCLGESYEEMATHLSGTPVSLRKMAQRIMNKTGTKSRHGLVGYVLRNRVIH